MIILRPVRPASPWGPPNEFTRGVDVEVARGTVVDGKCGLSIPELDAIKGGNNNMLMDKLVHFSHGRCNLFSTGVGATVVSSGLFLGTLRLGWLGMLCGDNNSVDLDGSDRSIRVLGVLNGDLGLSIGAQPPKTSILPHVCQTLS